MHKYLLIMSAALLMAGCSQQRSSNTEQANADRVAAEALQEHRESTPEGTSPQHGNAPAAVGILN